MTDEVQGRVAIVTGGASGIGAASAALLAAEGACVLIADMQAELGEKVVAEICAAGGQAAFAHHDVRREADWERSFEQARSAWGQPSILFNNAGVSPPSRKLEQWTPQEWDAHMSVNSTGVFLGIKHAILAMKKTGGAIVNTSSIYGIVGASFIGAYSASKGAVRTLTKAAAAECCSLGYDIRINSIHPGFIDTPMKDAVVADLGERAERHILKVTPMRRTGKPEDIASGVLYLVSDRSAFVTGTELVIDGGMLAV
jgi:3(or 17)beta-hydroxysteroid dehydrogenase